MKRGMKTFSRSIPDSDFDKAQEMFEKIVQGNMDDEIWRGYRRALEGVLEVLDSESDLRVVSQISRGNFSLDRLEELRDEMENRSSQEFRPKDEIGYNAAWSDILTVLVEDKRED